MSSTSDPRFEAQLRRAQKMELAGRLACGHAHDFNNLLQVIAACLDGITGAPTDTGFVQEQARQASQALTRASDAVRQLAAFGCPDARGREPVDLNDIVRFVMGLCRPIAAPRIAVAVHLQSQPLMVRADAGELEQALMNLCVNARDAMPDGGVLRVRTQVAVRRLPHAGRPPSAFAMVDVLDTGVGIPLDVQDRVFEPFFTTKGPADGSGLGLAMVDGTIKSHGGFVEMSSEPGVGTLFRLFLPLCRG